MFVASSPRGTRQVPAFSAKAEAKALVRENRGERVVEEVDLPLRWAILQYVGSMAVPAGERPSTRGRRQA